MEIRAEKRYVIKKYRKIFTEKDKMFFFDIPKYIQTLEETGFSAEDISRQLELSMEDHTALKSVRTLSRVREYCEGYLTRDGKEPSISITTIKLLGLAFDQNEYAFLQEVKPELIGKAIEEIEMKESEELEDIYRMLYEVLDEVEVSSNYSFIPNTQEDGFSYYDERLNNIRKEVSIKFLKNKKVREKLYRIIDEMEYFVKSYSIPGTPERWNQINPAITYFDCVYDILDSNPELYRKIKEEEISFENGTLVSFQFYPTEEEIERRKEYFKSIEKQNKDRNLQYSMDRLFRNELLNTLEQVFINDFGGEKE